MGQRTKNRILEHSRPGHRLERSDVSKEGHIISASKSQFPGKSFWICKCGWEGWLTDDLNTPE